MTDKVVVSKLYKVFGPQPQRAMELLAQGLDKDEIFRRTGMVVGVQDANFSVREGEVFVLMGLSGSGKSTLIRLLNRLVEPSHGQVLVGGRDVAAMGRRELVAMRRKDLAMVFQSFALLPHLTVLSNTAFGLEVAGVDRRARERRAMEVLEQVGLSTFAHKRPHELSGGMQQRVGLARALAVDPTLMLMDEAFSALDPLKRTEMQELLLQLQREQQRTIVFVSHDLDEAFRIGNRIAIMKGGAIVQIGTPDEILRNPGDAYVEAFFKGVDVKKYLLARDVVRADVVPTRVPSADGVADLQAMAHQLRQSHQQHALVLASDGRLTGVVSRDSVQDALEAGATSLGAACLDDVTAAPHTLNLHALIGRVVACPAPLPVVDDAGVCLGVVTQTMLLQRFAQEEEVAHG
ncbi:MAG: betaine/proline/choline family ABC transporter ATP-binding protein [Burkholderiaceae bacterium]